MTDKSKLEANEKIQTQIDASIGIARSLIQSWLPPPQLGEKLEEDQDDLDTMDKYATGRPDRLGLGAKFLSHKDAMRHNQDGSLPSKQEIQLKNKILNQNKRAERDPVGKRSHASDSEDEEESRTKQQQPKKKSAPVNNKKKKIGQQGDFLSMYLSERQQKKKSKK
ncbi:uncharacterized protein B0P05DRAFT_562812, partial [Gilbertella persicaria]|uniref:uncharacterized protein n=1 Tax=Gilbertella persicaria TaxID=101096 RepID=UPI002220D784